jgi:LEA14-like dessication related protein
MRPLTACLLLLGLAGCGYASGFTPPDVTVQQVAVTGLDITGGTMRVALRIDNPNPYALRTTRGALTLALDEREFGTLELRDPLRLPARADTVVHLPLRFSWSGAGSGVRAMLSRGSVAYRVTGRLELDIAGRPRGVAVSGAGVVALADLVH